MGNPSTESVSIEEKLEQDRKLILEARGPGAKLKAFLRLSGPGWLQSAITLGGGSLAGGLFLGHMAGYSAMWVQPLAMLMGVIMLSAIGYVTLSTGERPFDAINRHINPVLGWGWIVATMLANMVWCMPQYGLGTAALQENLGIPDTDSWRLVATGILALVAGVVVWFYNTGSKGIQIFEIIIKVMVAIIVLSFVGVVLALAVAGDLPWGRIFAGLVPNFGLLFSPAATLMESIETVPGLGAQFWTDYVVGGQRDRMITVAATAVGINMTFLLPYSMLARKWDKDFRGMAIFDLATALFLPFIVVTACIVIAATHQLHNQPAPGLLNDTEIGEEVVVADPGVVVRFERLLNNRVLWELQTAEPELHAQLAEDPEALAAAVAERRQALPDEDLRLAAIVVDRDAWDLARALEPLTGSLVAQYVFGAGVLGVALSTLVILMVINGFAFAEMFGKPGSLFYNRLGALVVLVIGAVGSLTLWQDEARYFLVIPTSVFGMMLAPIAYLAFFAMMNNPRLMGNHMPSGARRVCWNILMGLAVAFAVVAACLALWSQDRPFPGTGIETRFLGIGVIVFLVALATVIHCRRRPGG
jgi:Mn2+/Fe2+ NRAMP family transporter